MAAQRDAINEICFYEAKSSGTGLPADCLGAYSQNHNNGLEHVSNSCRGYMMLTALASVAVLVGGEPTCTRFRAPA